MAKVGKRKSATTRKPKASKLITKGKFYAMKPNAKNITVSTFGKNGKMVNKYIKNTKVNREKIIALKGQPNEFYNGRYMWL